MNSKCVAIMLCFYKNRDIIFVNLYDKLI